MEKNNLKSFKDLNVWQKSVDLAVLVYRITKEFPQSELYGLVSQMRRAVISVSSNLAEGFKRINKKEKMQFYNIAYGSIAELESQIEISKRIGFLSKENYQILMADIVEVSKMIDGLTKSLNILNSKSYILNPQSKAFTMVEMIVALGLFIVVLTIATGSLIKGLRMQKEIGNLVSVNSNISQTLEQMGREIRTGRDFSSPSPSSLKFINAYHKAVTYQLNGKFIERKEDDEKFSPITAENVLVNNLKFILKGENPGDGLPPRITIIINISPSLTHIKDIHSIFQTTISCRNIDT